MSPSLGAKGAAADALHRLYRRGVLGLSPSRDRGYASLTAREAGQLVYCLHNEAGLSFSEIAVCVQRDRRWVRERYEEQA